MNKKLISTNPAKNFETVGEVTISESAEITEKVHKAQKIKTDWKELGPKKRVELLKPIHAEFVKHQEELAQLITQEVGKPIRYSRNEAKGYAEEMLWFMEHVESALADEITYEDEKSIHKIVYEPYGKFP